jgi:hypothetical protein
MSDAIRFLESMGGDSSQALASSGDYAASVEALDIDGSQRRALLDRDHAALSEILGGRRQVLCSVFAPDEQEDGIPEREPDHESPEEAE